MKSNNKVFSGNMIDNLFGKSWALLPYAIRHSRSFEIIEPKSRIFFCFNQFFFRWKQKKNYSFYSVNWSIWNKHNQFVT